MTRSRSIVAKTLAAVVCAIGCAIGLTSPAQAYPILNVDLQNWYWAVYTGAGVIPSGSYWNEAQIYGDGPVGGGGSTYDNTTPSYLLYDDGVTQSPVVINAATGADDYTYSPNNLLLDGLSVGSYFNGTGSFSISGLDPNTALGYDLVLYSYSGTGPTYFDLGGDVQMATASSDGPYVAGNNYVEYASVFPDNTGTISFTLDYQLAYHAGPTDPYPGMAAQQYGILNGFQIQELPEPASAGILAIGGVVLLRRRRGC